MRSFSVAEKCLKAMTTSFSTVSVALPSLGRVRVLDACVAAKDFMAGIDIVALSVVLGAVVTEGSFGTGVLAAGASAGFVAAGACTLCGAAPSGREEEIMAGSSGVVASVGGGGPPGARRAGGVYRFGCPEARGWKLR